MSLKFYLEYGRTYETVPNSTTICSDYAYINTVSKELLSGELLFQR